MSDNAVVHIVDDDEAARQSLAFLLSTAGMAVRLYPSATAFLEAIDDIQPGCLITDVRMPDMNGIELLKTLKAKGRALPTIVITGHGDIALAVEAMKAGALDFIEKPFEEEAMLTAVQSAKELATKTGDTVSEDRAAILQRFQSLSTRERQVLDGLIAGSPNKVIAHDLGISPRTVEVYRANLMAKMEAKSLSHLIRMALLTPQA